MEVTVIGAGVVGVASAWYLSQAGHRVTVIERRESAGLETSFANGGQISVSHAEPWAAPGTISKALRWMFQPDSPLLYRPRLDPLQWRWMLSFMSECTAARFERNVRNLAALGTSSRALLRELRERLDLRYEQRFRGIMHIYFNRASFDSGERAATLLRKYGATRRPITAAEAVQIEPALARVADRLVGASFTDADESGDAYQFTVALAQRASEAGVRFQWSTTALGFEMERGAIRGLSVIDADGQRRSLQSEAWLLCAGSYSPALARSAGVDLLIYPAKGYSITVPVVDPARVSTVSLTDDQCKLVMSRLGERLRIAGTAELAGFDTRIDPRRVAPLIARGRSLFGDACDWSAAQPWTGLRPSTPSNLPYIGRSTVANLLLNTGHGTLGWTHACGSGHAIAQIASGYSPDVNFDFCNPGTLRNTRSPNPDH